MSDDFQSVASLAVEKIKEKAGDAYDRHKEVFDESAYWIAYLVSEQAIGRSSGRAIVAIGGVFMDVVLGGVRRALGIG